MRRLIASEIEHVNRLLPEHSRVRSFANFPKPLDPDEGELTRTRKLRRGFLAERYGQLIDALYGQPGPTDIAIPVRYQDGKQGVLRAAVHVEVTGAAPAARDARMQSDRQTLAVAS